MSYIELTMGTESEREPYDWAFIELHDPGLTATPWPWPSPPPKPQRIRVRFRPHIGRQIIELLTRMVDTVDPDVPWTYTVPKEQIPFGRR